ncbi:hypothetical protein A6769_15020 [Nostoc punctiforme NIES-2108]|uniref:Uncharacterized protein n=1 Tax=Nostoc punctiforme NIES-2108 TaxID=1356359 RepID=A0A367RLA4_NOSPU|nr:hypothetical protein A6769_15020 [Nostoc punctiforme NIES-2108]
MVLRRVVSLVSLSAHELKAAKFLVSETTGQAAIISFPNFLASSMSGDASFADTIFLGLSACVVDIKNAFVEDVSKAIATAMLNNIDRVGAARRRHREKNLRRSDIVEL